MSLHEVTIAGTIQPDGTLKLDAKPNLRPGRVSGILRQETGAPAPPEEDWFQFMQTTRAKMVQAGCRFLDENEMNAHLDWLREEDRIDEMLRNVERQSREQP